MNNKKGQMTVFRPMRSNWRTQSFNQNLACIKTDINNRIIYPTKVVSKNNVCPVGYKDFYKAMGMKGHPGWDHACWEGEPIYFPVDADCEWWVRNEIDQDGGIGLDVFSDRPIDIGELPKECGRLAQDQYNGIYGDPKYGYEKHKVFVKIRLWHLSKSLVSDSKNNIPNKPEGYRDTKVKLGDLIALGGNTGASSGSHLHWSMKIVANNSGTLDSNNGYYGAVDFEKYYEDKFVVDVLDDVKEMALTAIDLAKKVIFNVQKFINSFIS